jgi:hypothetical protein
MCPRGSGWWSPVAAGPMPGRAEGPADENEPVVFNDTVNRPRGTRDLADCRDRNERITLTTDRQHDTGGRDGDAGSGAVAQAPHGDAVERLARNGGRNIKAVELAVHGTQLGGHLLRLGEASLASLSGAPADVHQSEQDEKEGHHEGHQEGSILHAPPPPMPQRPWRRRGHRRELSDTHREWWQLRDREAPGRGRGC